MSNIFDPRYKTTDRLDAVLIGAGIMSATLAYILHKLEPTWRIEVYERLPIVAGESSDAWNNAGTGHSGFCELNYTPQKEDGSVSIDKAIHICEQFEETKQFWAYLVEEDVISNPQSFIHNIPHFSAVFTKENKSFLKKRWEKMIQNPLFSEMEFSDKSEVLEEWIPLLLSGRAKSDAIAATKMKAGCDIDFGSLTRQIFQYLEKQENFRLYLEHEVRDIDLVEEEDHLWQLKIRDLKSGDKKYIDSKFVFIGAGGGALHLLQKTDIDEGQGFGGFPVSGQWLICQNEKIINQHFAKVYGKADVGAPPMSVPHLDSRIIEGKRALLFGPYAGFSTKFLKNGSYWDLFESIGLDNIKPLVMAGIQNVPLTKYLINQVRQSHEERMEELRKFIPNAKSEDWKLEEAGQRVQVIRKDDKQGGVLEFGTEVVHANNGSVAALLGASPGASTAVSVMLEVLESCFKNEMKGSWSKTLKELIPSHGVELGKHPEILKEVRKRTNSVLCLD
jgi:malate dehydrogenase (quinone)